MYLDVGCQTILDFYLGSGVLASALGMDKHRSKLVLQQAGIPTAPWRLLVVDPRKPIRGPSGVRVPVVVKPNQQGSAIGVTMVRKRGELRSALRKASQYDHEVIANSGAARKGKPIYISTEYAGGRKAYYNNRVKYVLAREGDSFYSLSEELDLFQWQLPKYNDLPNNKIFNEGEKVYLQPKRNKGEAGKNAHIVSEGETLLAIAQLYAIKLEKLARRNQLTSGATLTTGQEILLRGRIKGSKKPLSVPKIEIQEEEPEEEFIIEFDADS